MAKRVTVAVTLDAAKFVGSNCNCASNVLNFDVYCENPRWLTRKVKLACA